MPHHFVVGDRVRLVETHPDRATGQFGTVMQTYPMPGVYAVQFDGEPEPRVVAGPLLAGVPGQAHRVQGMMTFRSE
jgi:hypothetical protein